MKELTRFVLYTVATALIILFIVFMARFDNKSGSFLVGFAVFMVVVLPVMVGLLMARRERSRSVEGDGQSQ
ncbi:MAG: hypothetical protein LBV36_00350 [Chromatiales bacterium]|nr:hypothetical protein [Chromatiales bacterium]